MRPIAFRNWDRRAIWDEIYRSRNAEICVPKHQLLRPITSYAQTFDCNGEVEGKTLGVLCILEVDEPAIKLLVKGGQIVKIALLSQPLFMTVST
jgi:hypothetical protein